MKTINSLSAGESSSYMAVKYPADYELFSVVCINDPRCAPKDPAITHYAQAKLEHTVEQYDEFIATAEDDRSLRVMMDLEQYIGREIVWVRGRNFDEVIGGKDYRGVSFDRLPSRLFRYCTIEMKLLPIFDWWFLHVGEKVKMRIGFRFDEYDRMERFMNNGVKMSVPVACSTKGQRKQRFETFDWRFVTFPLIKDAITKPMIKDYWREHGYVGEDSLFERRRKMEFPEISNCVGCFHKSPEVLCVMWNMHPEKMRWFAEQEHKGMGTWLDSKVTYEMLAEHAFNTPYSPEMIENFKMTCDSGGCTD